MATRINRKPIPPYLTFEQALQRGFVPRMESAAYTGWVKKLLCCCGCGQPADDPHHPVSVGFKGTGTKAPDYWVIPLTRRCHDQLHHDVEAWEQQHGSQMHHAVLTLTQAIYEGVLS